MITSCTRLLSIILLAALSALLFSACGGDSPSAVVEEFLKAAQAKDCQKMVELVDVEGSSLPRDELVKACEQQAALGEIKGYSVKEETIDGDTATVNVEVTTSSGGQEETQSDTLKLIRKDGEWKLQTQ